MDIKKLKKSQKGGLKKTDYSLADLITIFKEIPESDILNNLSNYLQIQIDKLEKIKTTLIEKIDDRVKIDYDNREKIKENINSLIPGDEEENPVKKAYLQILQSDVGEFMDSMRNSNFSVQQIEEFISKFRAVQDKINIEYVRSYKDECIKIFEDNFENSDTLISYKEELLEYLIIVLAKGDIPNQNPFCVVLTGSPGLGKSSLANQIVKLLKVTNLLPIGKFINIKKPDVLGQYLGQTAPKTYKILTSAIGSIAFIDEAYSFAGEERPAFGFDHFGKEFIDALVDFIEEYKGLISIVAAGYKDEMEKQFFKVNTGLYRRFPIQLDIKELTAISILKNLFDNAYLHEFLSEEPMRNYIQNFIRLAFNIEQPTERGLTNIIAFFYYYIDSDGKRKRRIIEPSENHSFMRHFFVKNGLFSNNWTDVQIFIDFLMNNIKLDMGIFPTLKNTIKGYLSTKLENSNIEIIVELMKHSNGTNNMFIKLMTNDNAANGTIKTFDSKKLKKNENEKTTEKELFEYFFKEEYVPTSEPPKPTGSKSSSSTSSASAASAASSNSNTDEEMKSTSDFDVRDALSVIKYVINNVDNDLIRDNYYLENFIRTMFNIEQFPTNKIEFKNQYTNTIIKAREVSSFIKEYLPNIVNHIDEFVEIIEYTKTEAYDEGDNPETIIPMAIFGFLRSKYPDIIISASEWIPKTIITFQLRQMKSLNSISFTRDKRLDQDQIDKLKKDPVLEALSVIKYVINNVDNDLIRDNYYLENFIRTMFNIEQFPTNKIEFKNQYTNTIIKAREVSSFIKEYLPNIVSYISQLVKIIKDMKTTFSDNPEMIIPMAIFGFLNNKYPDIIINIGAGNIFTFELREMKRLNSVDLIRDKRLDQDQIDKLKKDPVLEALSVIKYVINNVDNDLIRDNYYLENFIRTMFNIEQFRKNQIEFKNRNTGKIIKAREVFSFIKAYFRNIVNHIDEFVGIIESVKTQADEDDNPEMIIPDSIYVFLRNRNLDIRVNKEIEADGKLIITFELREMKRLNSVDLIRDKRLDQDQIDRLKR